MDLNWRAGAEGLLGGYQAVLAQKMKEDYENRMEEARMNRQMNLEKWKNENITLPAEKRQEDYKIAGEKRDYDRINDPTNIQYKVIDERIKSEQQSRDLAVKQDQREAQRLGLAQQGLEIQRQNAKNESELRSLQISALKDEQAARKRDEENPVAKELLANEKLAEHFGKVAERNGQSPEQAKAMQAMVLASGMTKPEQINNLLNKDPESTKKVQQFVLDTGLQIQKDLATADPTDIISRAAQLSGKAPSGVEDAKNTIMFGGMLNAASTANQALGLRSQSTSPPPLKEVPPPEKVNFTNEDLATVSTGVYNKSPEALELYNTLKQRNPEQARRIDNWINYHRTQLQKPEDQMNARLNMPGL